MDHRAALARLRASIPSAISAIQAPWPYPCRRSETLQNQPLSPLRSRPKPGRLVELQTPFLHEFPLEHSLSAVQVVVQALPLQTNGAQSVVLPSGLRRVWPSTSQIVLVGTQSLRAVSQR